MNFVLHSALEYQDESMQLTIIHNILSHTNTNTYTLEKDMILNILASAMGN